MRVVQESFLPFPEKKNYVMFLNSELEAEMELSFQMTGRSTRPSKRWPNARQAASDRQQPLEWRSDPERLGSERHKRHLHRRLGHSSFAPLRVAQLIAHHPDAERWYLVGGPSSCRFRFVQNFSFCAYSINWYFWIIFNLYQITRLWTLNCDVNS
jgi:hypothetical protein